MKSNRRPGSPLHPRRFTRRALLGGGAAAAALSPFVPLLADDVQAQTKRLRLGLVFWSGGTTRGQYLPTGTETNFTFSPLMQSLEPHKSKLVVFGNMRRAQDNARGSHQAGTAGTWTAARMLAASGAGPWVSLPSIDRIITKMVPQPTPLPTLDLDCQSQDPGNLRSKTLFDHDGRPIQGEQDPARVFDRVFTDGLGAGPPTGGTDPTAGERLRARRKSVLDLVGRQLTALSSRMGGQDRHKLEQHLTTLRGAEQRLSVPANGPGEGFTPPTRDSVPRLDFLANDNFPAVGKAHMDLMVAALAADRTRVASLQFSQGNGDKVFRWVGVTAQHHALTHRAEDAPGLDAIHRWHYEQFAYLVKALDAVKEGEGSLLDNCVVVFGNELISGFTHRTDPWPVLFAGGGGGRFKTGRFLNFPSAGDTRSEPNQTQFLTSLCHYMGAMVPRVGDPTMGPAGPLAALG